MGCYDTIKMKCTQCGKTIEEQSKAGTCNLWDYSLQEAPLSIIAALKEYPEHYDLTCPKCGQEHEVKVQYMVQLIPKEPAADRDWETIVP